MLDHAFSCVFPGRTREILNPFWRHNMYSKVFQNTEQKTHCMLHHVLLCFPWTATGDTRSRSAGNYLFNNNHEQNKSRVPVSKMYSRGAPGQANTNKLTQVRLGEICRVRRARLAPGWGSQVGAPGWKARHEKGSWPGRGLSSQSLPRASRENHRENQQKTKRIKGSTE